MKIFNFLLVIALVFTSCNSDSESEDNDLIQAETLENLQFSPTSGVEGDQILITWDGYSEIPNQTSITFNENLAQIVEVSSNYLSAIVPSGATTGVILAEIDGMQISSSSNFNVIPMQEAFPEISSITPDILRPGYFVTIEGLGFTDYTDAITIEFKDIDGELISNTEPEIYTETTYKIGVPPLATSAELILNNGNDLLTTSIQVQDVIPKRIYYSENKQLRYYTITGSHFSIAQEGNSSNGLTELDYIDYNPATDSFYGTKRDASSGGNSRTLFARFENGFWTNGILCSENGTACILDAEPTTNTTTQREYFLQQSPSQEYPRLVEIDNEGNTVNTHIINDDNAPFFRYSNIVYVESVDSFVLTYSFSSNPAMIKIDATTFEMEVVELAGEANNEDFSGFHGNNLNYNHSQGKLYFSGSSDIYEIDLVNETVTALGTEGVDDSVLSIYYEPTNEIIYASLLGERPRFAINLATKKRRILQADQSYPNPSLSQVKNWKVKQ